MPIATEQLARLPIIIIINHADFTVFSRTAGACTGQGAAGASGIAKQAGKGRVAGKRRRRVEYQWRTEQKLGLNYNVSKNIYPE